MALLAWMVRRVLLGTVVRGPKVIPLFEVIACRVQGCRAVELEGEAQGEAARVDFQVIEEFDRAARIAQPLQAAIFAARGALPAGQSGGVHLSVGRVNPGSH